MADSNDPPQGDAIDRRSFIERLAALAAVGDVGRQPLAAGEAAHPAAAGRARSTASRWDRTRSWTKGSIERSI